MLISFKVINYKSILNPVCLNMLADTDDRVRIQNLYSLEGRTERVNPFSVIMGANGSGKSSVLDALNFTREVFLRRCVRFIPRNRIASESTHSVFEVCFCTSSNLDSENIQKYILDISPDGIAEENIMHLSKNEWISLWRHKFKSLGDGSKNSINIDWKTEKFSELESHEETKESIRFFRNLVFFNSIDNDLDQYYSTDMSPYTLMEISKLDSETRPLIRMDYSNNQSYFAGLLLELLHAFGVEVTNLVFRCLGTDICGEDEVHEFIESDDFPSEKKCEKNIEESEKKMQKHRETKKGETSLSVKTYVLESLAYEDYVIPIQEESAGTIRLVKLAFTMINGLLHSDDLVLIIDEMDAGLHDSLSAEVVKQFFSFSRKVEEYNHFSIKEHSQLIVTSHNTLLLKDGNVRKDQVWFTEMRKENRTTDLYSLADFCSVKSSEDFAENYLKGAYGAIPCRPTESVENGED